MKTRKLSIITIAATFAVAATFSGCSKGDTGATGSAGATGPAGTNGSNGVANLSTTTYSVTSVQWAYTTDMFDWAASFTNTSIPTADSDVVVGYWSNASSGWFALPVTNLIQSGDEMSFSYNNNLVSITYYTGGTAMYPPSHYTGYLEILFKVVVIPPAVQYKHPGTNWKDARAVQNLEEVQMALNRE